MRFKPRKRPEPAPMVEEASILPRAVVEALDKASLHERAEGEDHQRIAVMLPSGRAWMYEGEDESIQKLAEAMALSQEQAKAAAKQLDKRIRAMVSKTRRDRRAASSWVHGF
ncbi:hypothetical protein KUF54_06120 [Comamonas sp. Y33R10-2]|uniref:hypothetical protein n=1 Tax=Comamonas sp. Y33R10-2 TaxID=2853257 RepID=UPI001C5CBC59|nr:hypothetical protein [Comamonas sp. Y33R10-2]QXZ10779.1 hypothetical protein KUF54_06120 [Comamonas sp. Y33R10-2]